MTGGNRSAWRERLAAEWAKLDRATEQLRRGVEFAENGSKRLIDMVKPSDLRVAQVVGYTKTKHKLKPILARMNVSDSVIDSSSRNLNNWVGPSILLLSMSIYGLIGKDAFGKLSEKLIDVDPINVIGPMTETASRLFHGTPLEPHASVITIGCLGVVSAMCLFKFEMDKVETAENFQAKRATALARAIDTIVQKEIAGQGGNPLAEGYYAAKLAVLEKLLFYKYGDGFLSPEQVLRASESLGSGNIADFKGFVSTELSESQQKNIRSITFKFRSLFHVDYSHAERGVIAMASARNGDLGATRACIESRRLEESVIRSSGADRASVVAVIPEPGQLSDRFASALDSVDRAALSGVQAKSARPKGLGG